METFRFWLKGIRLYIALGSGIITIFVAWWAAVAYGGTVLYPTRVEEVYGWLAVGLLATALAIGPIYRLFNRLPGKIIVFEARRMIGVSAAWFALLHASITYLSLFKAANPLSLPLIYKQSFVLGLLALLVLLAMAFTSFDAAIRKMGIWWFRLHRFIYLAAGLTLLHIFMIGTHATSLITLMILFGISALLVVAYGIIILTNRRKVSLWQIIGLCLAIILLILVFRYGFAERSVNITQAATRTTVPQ